MTDYSVQIALDINPTTKSLEEIFGILDMPDAEIKRKGELLKPGVLRKRNSIALRSARATDSQSISEQWLWVENQLRPRKGRIKEASAGSDVSFTILVDAYKSVPFLLVPVKILELLADLGMPLNIEIYADVHGDDIEACSRLDS